MPRQAVNNVADVGRERVYTDPATVLEVKAAAKKVPKRLGDENEDEE